MEDGQDRVVLHSKGERYFGPEGQVVVFLCDVYRGGRVNGGQVAIDGVESKAGEPIPEWLHKTLMNGDE